MKLHSKGKGFARCTRYLVEEIIVTDPLLGYEKIVQVLKIVGSRKITFQLWMDGGSIVINATNAIQAVSCLPGNLQIVSHKLV